MALTGERITVDKTYAQMEALIAAEELNPFLWYKISDRGDRGLVFRAAATNRLETQGTRYMLCPATYATGLDAYDNDWIGVWNATKQALATEGQLTIWNGLVWVAGETLSGDSPDTEASGWTVIPKASFTNHEYIEIIFEVDYDFEEDWISKQCDNKGNTLGLAKSFYLYWYEPDDEQTNPIDWCDWNFETSGNIFENNKCYYIYNNSNLQGIYNNFNCGEISGNSNYGMIIENKNTDIINNSNHGEISGNSNLGEIKDNSNYGAININNNLGFIINNSNVGNINYNSNSGTISYNSNIPATTCSITMNQNNGNITGVWDADVTDAIVDKTGTA